MVHVALKRAVKTKLLPFNPADGCDLPRVNAKRLLPSVPNNWPGTSMPPPVHGRTCSSGWTPRSAPAAVNFSRADGQTSIGRRPNCVSNGPSTRSRVKTGSSRRRPARPDRDCSAIAHGVPQTHREQQQANRDLYGPDYRTDLDLIFAAPDGNFMKPDTWAPRCGILHRRSASKESACTAYVTRTPPPCSLPACPSRTYRSAWDTGTRTPPRKSISTRSLIPIRT